MVMNCLVKLGVIGEKMKLSYNKLWKLLIDKGINKSQLREMSNISTASLAKLGKGQNVNTDILVRICKALNCDISEIVEVIDECPDKDER